MVERQWSGKRAHIPAAVMRDVLNSGPCAYCGEGFFTLTIDHIVPVSKGGTNSRVEPGTRLLAMQLREARLHTG